MIFFDLQYAHSFFLRKIFFFLKKKKDKWHRLNESVFCNMSPGEWLTMIFMNTTQVSYVSMHPQP